MKLGSSLSDIFLLTSGQNDPLTTALELISVCESSLTGVVRGVCVCVCVSAGACACVSACVRTCGGGAVVPHAGGESAAVPLRVDGGHGGGSLCGGGLLARPGGLGLPPVGPPAALGRLNPTWGKSSHHKCQSVWIPWKQFHFFVMQLSR